MSVRSPGREADQVDGPCRDFRVEKDYAVLRSGFKTYLLHRTTFFLTPLVGKGDFGLGGEFCNKS
jgi:hypothetical protein